MAAIDRPDEAAPVEPDRIVDGDQQAVGQRRADAHRRIGEDENRHDKNQAERRCFQRRPESIEPAPRHIGQEDGEDAGEREQRYERGEVQPEPEHRREREHRHQRDGAGGDQGLTMMFELRLHRPSWSER